MKKYIIIFLTLFLGSCIAPNPTIQSKRTKTATLFPDAVLLEMTFKDLEFLGETEVSYEYTNYGLWINRIRKINNEPASDYTSYKEYVQFEGKHQSWLGKFFLSYQERALVKAYQEFPDADYIEPIVTSVKKRNMWPGGAKIKKTIKVKAYKLKIH